MDDLVKLGMSVRRIIQDDKSPGGLMIEYVPLQRFVDIVDQEAKGVIHQLAAEITRLRAALETARRDALEEADAVKVVRTVLHAYQRSMTPPDSGWGDMSYERGSYDNLPCFQAALKAYRALIQPNTSPS